MLFQCVSPSLVQKKALVAGARTSGSWSWTFDGDNKPHATIGYVADLTDRDNAWLRLRYEANGEPVDYKVRLVTTTPHYGGCRWWFICPLDRRDSGPPRRVAERTASSGASLPPDLGRMRSTGF
jgi:hypothetical protein